MFEEMTLEDTKTLQDGKCPDCSGTKILGGPEGPGSQNVMCDGCKSKFNMPLARGIPGERLGKYTPDQPGVPVEIPDEGSIIQGRGRTNVTCIALHDCCNYGKAPERHSGCVDLVKAGLRHPVAFLNCRSCGMRVPIPTSIEDWDGVVAHFADFQPPPRSSKISSSQPFPVKAKS